MKGGLVESIHLRPRSPFGGNGQLFVRDPDLQIELVEVEVNPFLFANKHSTSGRLTEGK